VTDTNQAVTARLDLILAKLDHQTEALDLILPASVRLEGEAVARARASLERARRSVYHPMPRALKSLIQANPEDRLV
jgi:hypothetical protein